jgi:2-methylisocitrate lyase-like PEP mutase family enzyme
MEKSEQVKRAQTLRALHRPPPTLLLPNAWDLMSALIFADAGYPAIATTSAGVAWALGYADGEKTPWAEVVDATARIAAAV